MSSDAIASGDDMEIEKYLANKRPNLSSPGTRVSDLYYSVRNSSVEVLESTCDYSNRVSLSNLNFGASNQINLPMSAFVGQVVLHLRVQNLAGGDTQTLCAGWGLGMLARLRYQFGTSASSPILLTKQAIWHTILAQCSTEEKRNAVIQLCGEGYIAPAVVDPLYPTSDVPTIDAYIPLPLPFSALCEKLMYDTTIIGQPITLFIDFESDGRHVYGGTAAPPTSFLVAELLVRQQRLYDISASLKTVMIKNEAYMYTYPYIMPVGFVTNGPFPGSKRSSGNRVVVQFNQFQNSDLLGIVMCVQREVDTGATADQYPNPLLAQELEDIEMTYNGGSIFQLPGKSYKAISTFMGDQQAQSFTIGANGFGANDAEKRAAKIQNCNLVYFDFSQLRSVCYQSHMYNTWRIPPGNVLTVSFYTPEGSTVRYNCFYTCYYNAVLTAQNGVSNIFTS